MLIIILFYTCISVRCDADPNANPEPNADPDALWDKLPALQKVHGAGKLHSRNPIQSFISPTQGNNNILKYRMKFLFYPNILFYPKMLTRIIF